MNVPAGASFDPFVLSEADNKSGLTQMPLEALMNPSVSSQLQQALALLQRHLGGNLLAVHLFGSAVVGGLKPGSDLDLLVTVATPCRRTRVTR